MRKVVSTQYVTLDGVMEDPGGLDTFKDRNWHFPFWSEDVGQWKACEPCHTTPFKPS
jgi:hypothetical protein